MTSNILQNKIKVLFMGTGLYGSLVFNELDTNFFNIIGIVTKSQSKISRNPNLNNELNIKSNNHFNNFFKLQKKIYLFFFNICPTTSSLTVTLLRLRQGYIFVREQLIKLIIKK